MQTHGEDVAGAGRREGFWLSKCSDNEQTTKKEDSLPLVSDRHFGDARTVVRGKKGGEGRGVGLTCWVEKRRHERVSFALSLKACQFASRPARPRAEGQESDRNVHSFEGLASRACSATSASDAPLTQILTPIRRSGREPSARFFDVAAPRGKVLGNKGKVQLGSVRVSENQGGGHQCQGRQGREIERACAQHQALCSRLLPCAQRENKSCCPRERTCLDCRRNDNFLAIPFLEGGQDRISQEQDPEKRTIEGRRKVDPPRSAPTSRCTICNGPSTARNRA